MLGIAEHSISNSLVKILFQNRMPVPYDAIGIYGVGGFMSASCTAVKEAYKYVNFELGNYKIFHSRHFLLQNFI